MVGRFPFPSVPVKRANDGVKSEKNSLCPVFCVSWKEMSISINYMIQEDNACPLALSINLHLLHLLESGAVPHRS